MTARIEFTDVFYAQHSRMSLFIFRNYLENFYAHNCHASIAILIEHHSVNTLAKAY